MKSSLLAGASCLALIACGGATSDQAPGASRGGSTGTLATGGAGGSSGAAGVRNSGGQTLGGSAGVSAGGSGGSGATPGGGAGGVGVDCCVSGCDEPCTPGTSRTCKGGTLPGSTAQDCRCDGSGWGAVRSSTTAGGACSVLDAGQEDADASTVRCSGPTLMPVNLYPNCDGKAQTICVEVPVQVCYCDGTTAFGFGIPVPIRHLGPCTDAERADAGATDAGRD